MTKILLAILVFAAFSILSNWLQRRAQKAQEEADKQRGPQPPAPPRPQRSRPQAPPMPTPNWQEELRRLLEAGRPVSPPQMPTPPPIPVPVPASAVPRRVAPPVAQVVEEDEGHTVLAHLPGLTESTEAYAQASHLEQKVESKLRAVHERVVAHKPSAPMRRQRTSSAEVRAWLRQPGTQRSAVMASVILGPPKAALN